MGSSGTEMEIRPFVCAQRSRSRIRTRLQKISSHPGALFFHRHTSSPEILACLKYFIPTHAVITHTHAMTPLRIISAG